MDRYIIHSNILNAVKNQLSKFKGRVLGVTCGNMPYHSLIVSELSQVRHHVVIDLEYKNCSHPDVFWDSLVLPIAEGAVQSDIVAEVFEHCPDPAFIMEKFLQVMKAGGFLFFTVPFIWPLHPVPKDEFRITPISLQRLLGQAGFDEIQLNALDGWDKSFAQIIGLSVRQRSMSVRKRTLLSWLAIPIIRYLERRDSQENQFGESSMIIGIIRTVRKSVTSSPPNRSPSEIAA